MTAVLAAARAIHFASLMAIFGGSTYALLLQRAGLWRWESARMVPGATCMTGVDCHASFCLLRDELVIGQQRDVG